ncbi:PspC domain-containing protein [Draconibacterium sp. IB214405]|uniref:PspC domain-containing protein n=1 Tax=Draconibacterium sp. IB214405 TaxID=3097352 RepID=UPI002A17F026|nr:PspC domain-containing protein [Draconibacterium sp. IB214405]MDX8337952.1 PspC domain-containing protein [Draconibacterium sp. IB214405]
MKKTFTINISGSIFHIEEDAYEVLQRYLINLKNHFGTDEEGKEIIADIEARIAEIFSSKSTEEKKVITAEWVNDMIEIMGTPEDFAEEEGEEEDVSIASEAKRKRRLYRDPDHRVLGGVCGGLGAYFNMDPVILRIIFAILFFVTSGAAGLAYLILWIAVPKAVSTAQRLEMRGQEATVKNIEKSIKEEVKEVKESYKKFKESDTYSKGKKSMEGAGDVVYNIFKVILKVFVIVFGVFLILSGFFGILGLVSSMIIGHSFVEGLPLIWGPEIHMPNMLNHFVEPGTVTWGLILVGLLTGIPLLALVYIGTKLVFRYKANNAIVALSMAGVWLVSLFALLIISVSQVGNYKQSSSITKTETVSCDSCQTLYLRLADDKLDDYAEVDWNVQGFKVAVIDGEEVVVGYPELDVVRSSGDDFVVTVRYFSRGNTRDNAKEWCEEMVYTFDRSDSTLYFDPYFYIGDKAKWRGQEVDIKVKVPEGKTVFLGDDMDKIIHDIENTSNTWDRDMVGKYWEMKPEGLTEKTTK